MNGIGFDINLVWNLIKQVIGEQNRPPTYCYKEAVFEALSPMALQTLRSVVTVDANYLGNWIEERTPDG